MSPTKTFKSKTYHFFKSKVQVFPHLLSIWTAQLQLNRLVNFGVTKWRKKRGSYGISKYEYIIHWLPTSTISKKSKPACHYNFTPNDCACIL